MIERKADGIVKVHETYMTEDDLSWVKGAPDAKEKMALLEGPPLTAEEYARRDAGTGGLGSMDDLPEPMVTPSPEEERPVTVTVTQDPSTDNIGRPMFPENENYAPWWEPPLVRRLPLKPELQLNLQDILENFKSLDAEITRTQSWAHRDELPTEIRRLYLHHVPQTVMILRTFYERNVRDGMAEFEHWASELKAAFHRHYQLS